MSSSTSRFDDEIRAFQQGRLLMLTGVLSGLLWALVAAFVISMSTANGLLPTIAAFVTEFPNSILFYLSLLTTAGWVVLRTRHLPLGGLAVVDGALLMALTGTCLVLYARLHRFSWSGHAFVVPFLILFILTRAVLIPSSATRTVLLSLPAALGVLGIQLYYGTSFAFPGMAYPPSHFSDTLIQNQVCLWGAVAVAMTASRVNLSLRRRNFDARRVGQYDVHEKIGAGAMGEVYRATHSLMKRETALKFLRPELAGADSLARFEQEVRLASRLTHPNNILIYDYGYTAEGVFYYAMELLDGATLKQVLNASGPMPAARAVHVLSQALSALAEAHEKGIVHRDVKAANIMLTERGGVPDFVKILDFGLAKRVDVDSGGEIAGSPETMSPEAIRGEKVDARSDLYSLSVVAYQLLTGRHPYRGESARELLGHHLGEPPEPLPTSGGLPEPLRELISRGLSKDPASRPSSAREYRARLLEHAPAPGWTELDASAWWERNRQLLSTDFTPSEISDSSSETRLRPND